MIPTSLVAFRDTAVDGFTAPNVVDPVRGGQLPCQGCDAWGASANAEV